MMKITPADVERVIEAEREHGREMFMYQLDSMEEAMEKYVLVAEAMSVLEDVQDIKLLSADERYLLLRDMMDCGLLTPAACARIMVDTWPDHTRAAALMESLWGMRSVQDKAVFGCVYYRERHELVSRTAVEEIQRREEDFKSVSYLNGRYAIRYGRDDSFSSRVFSGKCALYTVITGGYDQLKDPEYIDPDWDYYCFTDDGSQLSSDVWKIIVLDNPKGYSAQLLQRWAKLHPHEVLQEYDHTVYVDGKITVKGDLREYINTYSRGSGMLCFPHFSRNTLSQEADAILYYKKADAVAVRAQVKAYYDRGYDDSFQLVDTACLIRSGRDERLKKTMEDWWQELVNRTARDQLSFVYACWKNGYRYDISNLSIEHNPWLRLGSHV